MEGASIEDTNLPYTNVSLAHEQDLEEVDDHNVKGLECSDVKVKNIFVKLV